MSACVHTVVSEGGSTALTESQRGGSHCTSLGVMGVAWAARDLVTCKGTRRVALSCLGLFGLWEGSSVWLLCLLDSSSSPHAAPYTLLQTAVICFSQGLDAGTQVGFSPVKSTFPHLDALVLSHFRVLVSPLKLVLLNVWSLDQSVRQDCLRLYLGSSFCLSNCPFPSVSTWWNPVHPSGPSCKATSSRKSPWVGTVLTFPTTGFFLC